VTFKTAPDYESDKKEYKFTATVSDGKLNDTQEVTIKISDVVEEDTNTTAPMPNPQTPEENNNTENNTTTPIL
jgi:hypothetical protein